MLRHSVRSSHVPTTTTYCTHRHQATHNGWLQYFVVARSINATVEFEFYLPSQFDNRGKMPRFFGAFVPIWHPLSFEVKPQALTATIDFMPSQQLKYELLILDYGGVYSFEYDVPVNYVKIMLDAFGKIPDATEAAQISALSHEFAAARLTSDQYVSKVANILGTPVPQSSDFEDITISVTSPPSEPMRQLVTEAKNAGLKVSLLSNMYAFEVAKTKPGGRYDGFDFVSFSADAGLTKHETAFFNATLEHFGVSADKAFFVDDVLAYVETAKTTGLNALHADHLRFDNAEQLSQAVRAELFI